MKRIFFNAIFLLALLLALVVTPQQNVRANTAYTASIFVTPQPLSGVVGQTALSVSYHIDWANRRPVPTYLEVTFLSIPIYMNIGLHSPSDPNCEGTPLFEYVGTTYQQYTPPVGAPPGVWHWKAALFYYGHNLPFASSNCADGAVVVHAAPQDLRLNLTLSASSVNLENIYGTLQTPNVHASATLVGNTAGLTGKIFYMSYLNKCGIGSSNVIPYHVAFSRDANVNNLGTQSLSVFLQDPAVVDIPSTVIDNSSELNITGNPFDKHLKPVKLSDLGIVPQSQDQTFDRPGTYYWQAVFFSDAYLTGATTEEFKIISDCVPLQVVSLQSPPALTVSSLPSNNVLVGTRLNASVTFNAPGSDPSVLTKLYGPDDPTCAGTPLHSSYSWWGATVNPGYVAQTAGVYHWVADFSDLNRIYPSTSTNCADAAVTVSLPPSPEFKIGFAAPLTITGRTENLNTVAANVPGCSMNCTPPTVTVTRYGDAACTINPQAVSSGSYSTDVPISFTTAGVYYYKAVYTDPNNSLNVPSNCVGMTALQETSLSMQLSATTTNLVGTIGFSGPVFATATLANATPDAGGTVTYQLFDDPVCASPFRKLTPVTVTNGIVPPSTNWYSLGIGAAYWQATYSGDAQNGPSVSSCEQVLVNPAATSLALTLSDTTIGVGTQVYGNALLTNFAFTPTGKTLFKVFTDPDCTQVYASADANQGIQLISSQPVTFDEPGTYYWRSFYTGDRPNDPAISQCGAAGTVLTVNPAAGTLYAAPGGLTSGDCASWATACDLQFALSAAKYGNSIWVKEGTHLPHASNRAVSFTLKKGVAIYGGFAGTETLFSQRDPATRVTILSGDIGVIGDSSDNSYHVVNGSSTNNTAILDGFTITGGNANGASNFGNGGAVFNNNGSPTLRNLTITGNSASVSGGGLRNEFNSNPVVINVTFVGNTAGEGGGAIYNYLSDPLLTNVSIVANTTAGWGGGLTNYDSSPTLRNVTFSDNSGGTGGAIFSVGGSTVMVNTIVANSTGGDCTGPLDASSKNNLIEDAANACGLSNAVNGNILGVDPNLGMLQNNGGSTQTMALGIGSPAMDQGDNTTCGDTNSVNNQDQRDKLRPVDGDANGSAICDIGAFEYQRTLVTNSYQSIGTQDGWVLESGSNTNKGGTLDYRTAYLNIGDDAARKQYRSILSFGSGALPDNAVITKVTLKIKLSKIHGGGSPVSMFGGFMVDIKTGFFGKSTLELTDWQATTSKSVGPFNVSPVGGWYTLNLPKTLFASINKGPTFNGLTQIRLRFKTKTDGNSVANFIELFSGNATAASRPQLIVQYYVP